MMMLPVKQGDRVRNAFNGETFIFTHVSENAEVVQFDVYLEPGGMLTGTGMQHVHPRADEEFTVISGKLAVVVDGAPRMLEPGQSLNVVRGTPHYFRNGHEGETMRGTQLLSAALAGAAIVAFMAPADAQVLVGGNDTKVWWDDAGKVLQRAPGKDTISIIDIGDRENPRILSNLELENSIFGPPTNLAVHPSGDIALVANSVTQTKDGENWKPVPDNKVYVIDLKSNPPQRITTVEVRKQPSGLDISKKGDVALVTNRADNSISVLSISGKDVKVIDTVAVGDSVAHVAISPDGTKA